MESWYCEMCELEMCSTVSSHRFKAKQDTSGATELCLFVSRKGDT